MKMAQGWRTKRLRALLRHFRAQRSVTLNGKRVAHRNIRTLDRPFGQLHRRERSEGNPDPPRANGTMQFQHTALPIREDKINGESHEERMNGVARRDDHHRAGPNARSSEQAAVPRS